MTIVRTNRKSVFTDKMRTTIALFVLMAPGGVFPVMHCSAADGNGNENAIHAVDWVNAVAMGADPTGKNDCSQLAQKLLNTYSTVYFPKGDYRFDKGIVVGSNKTILGESDRASHDEVDSGGTLLSFHNTSGYAIQSTDGACNITLKNFTALGNHRGGGGIRLYAATAKDKFHKLQHLRVSNFSLDNIVLENICEPVLFDVQSSGSNANGLLSQSYGTKITNSQFYGNKHSGMKFTTGGALVTSCKVWGKGARPARNMRESC